MTDDEAEGFFARIEYLEKENESLRQQLALVQKRMDWEADRAAKLDVALDDTRQQLAECQVRGKEWEKLKDPVTLHMNLLRGIPAKLSQQMLQHLMGDALDTLLKQAKREALLEAAIVVGNMKGYDVEDIAGDLRIMAKELE